MRFIGPFGAWARQKGRFFPQAGNTPFQPTSFSSTYYVIPACVGMTYALAQRRGSGKARSTCRSKSRRRSACRNSRLSPSGSHNRPKRKCEPCGGQILGIRSGWRCNLSRRIPFLNCQVNLIL